MPLALCSWSGPGQESSKLDNSFQMTVSSRIRPSRRCRGVKEAASTELCAVASELTKDKAKKHAGMHEHCRICAEACRRCEAACCVLLTDG